MAGDDGVIRGPAGDGRVAGVTRADIAASRGRGAARAGRPHGSTYGMTGPEARPWLEVADHPSRALQGRSVSFHNETVEEAYESRKKWDVPDWQYDAWVSTYTAIAAGEMAEVTDHVLRLTGSRPLSAGRPTSPGSSRQPQVPFLAALPSQ